MFRTNIQEAICAPSEGLSVSNKDNTKAKNTDFLDFRMAITVFISLHIARLLLGSLGEEDLDIYVLVAGMIAIIGLD